MIFSLQRLLIVLGIFVIPFYELFFRVFPFVKVIAPDSRQPKELIAIWFALSIGLLAIFQGNIKPFKNKWLLILISYLLINLFMSPIIDLQINGIEIGDFYFWKPFNQVICFSLMIFAVSSSEIDIDHILKPMVICGTLMSIYVILQKFGFDQFWIGKKEQQFTAVTEHLIGGNLGQPTIVASFLVMLFPLSIYLRKYYYTAIIFIAIILTRSDMAILSVMFITILSTMKYFKISNRLICLIFILISVITMFFYLNNKNFVNYVNERSSGRIKVWTDIYTDIRDGAIIDNPSDYSFSGIGLGRFSFIFPKKHETIFKQAHSDPLEFIYDCGFIGFGLLIMSIWSMIKNKSKRSYSILISLAGIFFCSLGSFPFQLASQQFYSVLLIGLLHNKQLEGA